MSIEAKLQEMGLSLPEPFAPAGNYVPTTVAGSLSGLKKSPPSKMPLQPGQS